MSSPPPISDDDISERGATAASRRRKWLLAIFIVALIAGALLIQVFLPKPAPAPVVKHYTPRQAQAAERNIAAIQKQILGPPKAAPASSSSTKTQNTVRLQLSEADLNAYAATDPHIKTMLARKGVSAVQILLAAPSNIVLRAAIHYKGRAANLQISGRLIPDAKTMIRLQVASAKIGSVPIPPSTVATEVDKFVSKAAGPMRNRLPMVVDTIHVANHNLILTGTRQPIEDGARH